MKTLLNKLLGDQNTKALKRLRPLLDSIVALEPEYRKLTDSKLKAKTKTFKESIARGKSLDAVLPEAFATVREAADRTIKQRHFEVQLLGGIVLHQGNIAEMGTGEGKTLVATLPLYLNALAGKGAHLVTVNDYLARIGAGWMAPVYDFLGLSVGVLISGNQALIYDPSYNDDSHEDERLRHLRPCSKKEAYQCDITYGTNNEFGFDYLRDNMVGSSAELAQRELFFAIVDEVDSILIDEARTPLIISAPSVDSNSSYQRFAELVRHLEREIHYKVDEKTKAATLTDDGVERAQELLGVDNLYDIDAIELIYHLEQALKAQALFLRDRDYVVRDGEVIIVDEFTGRMLPGRRYSEGLHQAIEAKEGVDIMQESQTLATISFQNYFRLYNKLSGMTGTARTEEEEFRTVYNLDAISIPPNRPNIRRDLSDRIYKTAEAKYQAIAQEVKERHQKGQPVLIGTVSIEKNEYLGQLLQKHKVPHEVLNAKNNEREAGIVAAAGQKGAVTLATNIAGRGTDIVLGPGVADLGGLHVIGSERHESRRIDNQLRGRAGRQGDPGSTQFYVSLEDDLMRIFGGERIAALMNTLRVDEDIPIENRLVSRALEGAQKKVEAHNFDIRKSVLQYDDVMNRHREAIYSRRRKILENENLREDILNILQTEVQSIVAIHSTAKNATKTELLEALGVFLPLAPATVKKLETKVISEWGVVLEKEVSRLYAAREKQFGSDLMRMVERALYLQIMDKLWMEHLENMQHLREGIGLRGIGQRDPLTEYKKEAFELFNNLLASLDHEVASTIFRVAPEPVGQVETDLTQAANAAMGVSQSAKLSKRKSTSKAKRKAIKAKRKKGRR